MYDFGLDSKKPDPIVIYHAEELLNKYEGILIAAKREISWIFHSSNTISYENKGLFKTLKNVTKR